MKVLRHSLPCLLVLMTVKLVAAGPEAVRDERYWPHWRGPLMNGVGPKANPPIHWDERTHVRWKTRLPGLGHSTPVIWGDRIFLTTAIPVGEPLAEPIPDAAPGGHDNRPVVSRQQFVVLAIDRNTGGILWQREVHAGLPFEGGHYTGSLASSSPVVDGRRVVAFFGSYGLYCLDLEGSLIWHKDLGRMHSKHGHGEGSSPLLYGDLAVVNWDHEGQSFIVALDAATGDERWRVDRDEATSWSSPIVVEQDGGRQLIVNGTGAVRGYELESGRVLWETGGLSANVVASPVAGRGIVIAGSSYEKQAMLAVRLAGARGRLDDTGQVLWRRSRSTPYVPSPLLYEAVVYFLRHYQNVMSRVDIETGRDLGGPFRLGELRNIYASPVGAAGRVYVTSREGLTIVVSHSATPEVLALNQLDDTFSASAAMAGNELYLRGEKHLYGLAEPSPAATTDGPPQTR